MECTEGITISGKRYWKQRIAIVKVFFMYSFGHSSTHME